MVPPAALSCNISSGQPPQPTPAAAFMAGSAASRAREEMTAAVVTLAQAAKVEVGLHTGSVTEAAAAAAAASISHEDAVSIYRARLNGAGDDSAGLLATQYGVSAACIHKIWRRELCGEATAHLRAAV